MSDASSWRMTPVKVALAALRSFSGSAAAERFALRDPAARLVNRLTRAGIVAGKGVASRFSAAGKLVRPARPASPEERPDVFDPTPTEEQRLLRDSVRELAERELRPAAGAADEACAAPQALLDAAWGLGLATMAVPEALGGAGGERSPVASVLVAEELARGDMGLALAILAPVGVAHALARWGTAEQQEKYLPAFAGELFFGAALAISEPTPLFDPFRLATRARPAGSGWVLSGVKHLVPLAAEAEIFLVAADVEGEGPTVFVVERGTPGGSVRAEPAMGIRAAGLGRVELADARLDAGARLGGGVFPYEELVDLSRLAWSALAVGTGQAVLEYVIPYVNERIAFGEPVSHRQSVAFLVSNVAIELEAMRLLTLRAAARAEQGKPFHREAFLARTLAAEKGMEIGSSGVQLLGGHGFVKEHPVERWYRDLRAIGVAEGGIVA